MNTQVVHSKKKNRNPTKANKSTKELKSTSIAQYFVSELVLAAELCLDRNYVAINTLNQLFTYEILVSILKLDLSESIKAAAANLIVHLYVEPSHNEVVIPCLSRTWSDISKNETPLLPYVDVTIRNKFALLQEICGVYLKSMANKKWTPYALEVMNLLKTLVRFNFYGTTERLIDIVFPLLNALDRRADLESPESFLSSLSSKVADKIRSSFYAHEGEGDAGTIASAAAAAAAATAGGGGGEAQGDIEMSSPTMRDKDTSMVIRESSVDLELTREESSPTEKDISNINAEPKTWQEKYLDFIDSLYGLVILMLIAFPTFGLSLYILSSSAQHKKDVEVSSITEIYGMAVSCVFVVEKMLRLYCFHALYQNAIIYFNEWINCIDFATVLIDLVINLIVIIASQLEEGQNIVKFLRIFRVFRYLFKVMYLSSQINDVISVVKKKEIRRYSKTSPHEINTMIKIVEILSCAQKLIQDRNLSVFLRIFYKICAGAESSQPEDLFQRLESETSGISMKVGDFQDILLDVLMYQDTTLVQTGLDVLVAHFSSRAILLNNAKKVQLLISNRRQKQYHTIDQMLLKLQKNAATQELWGSLQTEDDIQTNIQTQEILIQLIDTCRMPRFVLEFNEEFTPEKDVQNLLRNLGFFDVAFEVYNLLEGIEEDEEGNIGESGENVIKIVSLCNQLMYWFILDNPENQELVFRKLDFFLSTLDEGIYSHNVIRAMFKNNETLMKKIPKEKIQEVVDLITKNGTRPQYLSLLTSITYVGDKNITENQVKFSYTYTSSSTLYSIILFIYYINLYSTKL